jgi:hypothetical protein
MVCATLFAGYSRTAQASQALTLVQASTPTPDASGSIGGKTSNLVSQASPPPPQSTEAAAASATAGAEGVNAVGTNGPAPLPTGDAAGAAGTGGSNQATGRPGDQFPWLIVGGVTVLALAGLLFAAMRGRRPAQTVTTGPDPRVRRRTDVRNLAAPGTAATTATTATTTVATEPGMVTCPNCGTSNASTEKYCRECGQDLGPAIEQMAAAQAATAPSTAPVDVVEANTPYLETVDRVDEQLEFVLSRARVVMGAAAGNDIVVDAAFRGWQTVSPQHAELRREQDGFVIVDRDSENGTFVNDMRTGENILADGDLVRLGDVRFYFRVPKGDA